MKFEKFLSQVACDFAIKIGFECYHEAGHPFPESIAVQLCHAQKYSSDVVFKAIALNLTPIGEVVFFSLR